MKCPPSSPVSPLAAKESFGFAPSPVLPVPCSPAWKGENCLPGWYGSEDNKSLGALADICTGNLSVRSPRRSLYKELRQCSEESAFANFHAPKPPMSTCAKKTLELLDLGNGEPNPFEETQKSIGSPFGNQPRKEIWPVSRRPYVWSVTGHLEQLLRITSALRRLFVKFSVSGGKVILENLGVPGMRPVWIVIASAPEVSFGMATRVNRTLSLMNFEEVNY